MRVTGDGHRGLSRSGASRSAFGSQLQAHADDGRDADARVADSRGRHPSPELVAPLHFCTGAWLRFAPLHLGQHVVLFLPCCLPYQNVNWSTDVVSLWPTGPLVNRSTNAANHPASGFPLS